MDLASMYRDLSQGVLRNVAQANNGSGEISVNFRPTLVMHINEGLNKLHTKFLLRENDLILQLYADVTNYHLLKRFAQYAGAEFPPENYEERRYILDLPDEPFKEDVAQIMTVFNMNGQPVPLNDEFDHRSVFTPQQQILQVPNPVNGTVLSIGYQALHPKLSHEDENAFIHLPEHLLDALKAYVGYKVFSDMNQKDARERAIELMTIFESTCDEILLKNLASQSPGNSMTPFAMRGFV
jgi:hypothetical protein